jgi:SHS family lactate transporter-like MFS transporter
MEEAPTSQSPSADAGAEDRHAALVAGFLGWTLDAFDFFLVVMALTAIGKDFGRTDADVAISLTVTLAFRPVGALLFGLIADRFGRRIPLMVDLVFYSVVEVLTGLAPNFTTFMVLRALYGIGMGAEWGVGATLVMEKAPSGLRGLVSGLLQEGYAFGYLLAAACYYLVFPHFGWRPMFFIGGLPALLALYVRSRVKESEVWENVRPASWGEIRREIASHWKLLVYLTALMAMMNMAAHGTQDLYPTFLQRSFGFSPEARSGLTAFSMVGAIFGGVFFGFFSDRWGRRLSIVIALLLGMAVIPAWAFAPSLGILVAGAFFMQFMVQGAWGVIPAHIMELSPERVRGFIPGFAYQSGALLASGIVYLEALFAQHLSYARTMAATAAVVFALTALVAALGRERRGAVFAR